MLDRRGLTWLFALAAAAGCHRREPSAPPLPPRPAVAARPAAPAPFTHPLLAQADPVVSHEDCSKEALWVVAQQLRALNKQAVKARAAHGQKGDPAAASANSGCLPPAAQALDTIAKGPLLDRVGGCVGRDGPYDPEWDLLNSGVLSLGVCLDCNRTAEQRTGDCKHAVDAVERADKSSRKGTVAERTLQVRGGH